MFCHVYFIYKKFAFWQKFSCYNVLARNVHWTTRHQNEIILKQKKNAKADLLRKRANSFSGKVNTLKVLLKVCLQDADSHQKHEDIKSNK